MRSDLSATAAFGLERRVGRFMLSRGVGWGVISPITDSRRPVS